MRNSFTIKRHSNHKKGGCWDNSPISSLLNTSKFIDAWKPLCSTKTEESEIGVIISKLMPDYSRKTKQVGLTLTTFSQPTSVHGISIFWHQCI
jgi:hypothetical protein